MLRALRQTLKPTSRRVVRGNRTFSAAANLALDKGKQTRSPVHGAHAEFGPTTTLVGGLMFPESPRWHNGEFYYVDMHDNKAFKLKQENCMPELVAEVPNDQHASGMGWDPEGNLIIVSMKDNKLYKQQADGSLKEWADLSGVHHNQSNDMVVDDKGRCYVVNFGYDWLNEAPRTTNIALVDTDGTVSVAADDVLFPNGAVITPDGKTYIQGQSFADLETGQGMDMVAFDRDPVSGKLSNKRVWAKPLGLLVPDGCCLDSEGGVWVANVLNSDSNGQSEVIRLVEGGDITHKIRISVQHAIACMLGGDNGDIMYICSADHADPSQTPILRSGKIEAIRVPFQRAGYP